MSRLKEFALMGREWIRAKLTLAIGLMLGIAFMVSGGPQLQETLVALFDVSKVSLYELIVPGGIALDRGLKPWILAAFEMPWLITGMAAAIVTVQMKSWRGMVIAICVTVAVVLTVIDVVFGTIYGVMTIYDLITNISANILGGLSIGMALFLILWMSLYVCKAIGAGQEHQGIVTGTIATILGLIISLVLYVAMATVSQPMKVKARILAKLPIKGVIGKTYAKEEDGEDKNRFQSLSQDTKVARVGLRGANGLEWDWMRVNEGVRYSISVYAVTGCSELDQAQELTKGEPIIEIGGVDRVRIVAYDLINQFVLEGQQTGVSVERDTVSLFWLDKNNSGKDVDLTEFLPDGTTISGDTQGDMALLVTAMTFQEAEGAEVKHQSPRTFHLQINNEKIRPIMFAPIMFVPPLTDENLICKSLDLVSGPMREIRYDNVVLAGLYAEIKRVQPLGYYSENIGGKYNFHKANGWFRRQNELHGDVLSVAAEKLNAIFIQTPIHEIFVNGEPYEVPTDAGFRGHGKNIRVSYDEASGLTLSGDFHAAWMDERRLNLTRWERWTFDAKMSILAIIVSIAGVIVTLIYRTRKKWIAFV